MTHPYAPGPPQPPAAPYVPSYGYIPPPAPPGRQTNGLAIGSMVTSIVGMTLLSCYGAGLPVGLVGAILGHVARRRIKASGEDGDGMALAGVIIGWVTVGLGLLGVAAVVGFVIWIANQTPTADPYSF